VHAGETHASLVMSKLLYELCLSFKAEKNKYDSLLQNYVIKLVPMINADGVVIGNSRTSLVGLDLNRRWT
jgi:murein tripeptide amidase MpaA